MTIPTLPPVFALLGALMLASCAAQALAADKPGCQYVQLAKLPLRYTGPSLELTMDGTIDGTPANLLVDTGAFETALTRTGTEKRGLSLSMTGKSVVGIGGYSRLYNARVREITAGPTSSGKGWLPVIGDTGYAPAYDAIVGAPFLLQRDLEIALAEKEIRFFNPAGCEGAHLAYWDADAVAIPFEYYDGRSPNPHFKVEINGKELDAIIDTGATTTTIDARAARRIGLRLDAPNVQRNGSATGIGERRPEHFSTVVDTLKIGRETIHNAQVGIIDTGGELRVGMLLGADFLRAHRVLFAMSQKKLYISYVGGKPLGQRRTLEPWIVQEAEAGNPDAQVALGEIYDAGRLVPRNRAKADEWLEKAAAQGHPRANLLLGRKLMLSGARWEEAARRMSAALEQLPAERYGPLWLYIARVRMGEAANAKRGLEKAFARDEDRQWPAPIADFYLGRLDAAALMDAAGKDPQASKSRTCQAAGYMAEWHAAQGDDAGARALNESRRAQCGAAPAEPGSAAPQA